MQMILTFLLTSTLFLTVNGLIVLFLMRLFRCHDSRLTQIVWGLVLLQGIIVFRFPVNLPLLASKEKQMSLSSSQSFVTDSENAIFPEMQNEVTSSFPVNVQAKQPEIAKTLFIWNVQHTLTLLFAVWIFGIAGLVFWQIYSWLLTLNLLLSQDILSELHEKEWLALLEKEKIDPAKLRLIMTGFIGPGLFKLPRGHTIVIPGSLWQEASPEVRRGILRHELSHYRHHDLAKSFLLRLITFLHWFNPVAWLAIRRFEEAVEWRCDIEAFGHDPQGCVNFAEAMLTFRDTTPVAAVYRHAFCSTNIITRVKRLVAHNENKGDPLMKKRMVLIVTTLLLCLGLFRFHLTAKPIPEESSGENFTEISVYGEKDFQHVKIRGKALLPDGQPAKGFEIRWGGQFKKQKNAGGSGNGYVAEDGSFSLSVFAEMEGMIAILDSENKVAAPYQLFSVDDKDSEEELVFQFEPGIKISGIVRDKNTSEPIPNLEMILHIHDDPYVGVHVGKNTDQNGRYEWAVIPQGNFYVTVGQDFTYLTKWMLSTEKSDQKNDYYQKAEFDGQKEITLDFNIPSPFVGQVINVDGSPATDVTIQIIPYNKQEMSRGSSFTKSDGNGVFRCPQKPENVSVEISDYHGYYLNWFDKELCEDKEHVFQLKPLCTIKGRLLDASTGKPMSEQLLLYHGYDPGNPEREEFSPSFATTDKDGFFILNGRISDNVYYNLFIAPGRNEPGAEYPIRVELREVLVEKPGETVDLGDIQVDLTQAKRVEN